MSGNQVTGRCLLAFSVLCFSIFADAAPAACQAAQLPEKPEQHQHHHMDLPSGAKSLALCHPAVVPFTLLRECPVRRNP